MISIHANSSPTKVLEDRFTDPWIAQKNQATDADGNTVRFSFRFHSEESILCGTSDAAKSAGGSALRVIRKIGRTRIAVEAATRHGTTHM